MVDFSKLVKKPELRPEVQTLVDRGNITLDDIKDLRCNSEEWLAIDAKLDDSAFIDRMKHTIKNCSASRKPSTYDESVVAFWGPEALRRFEEQTRELSEVRAGYRQLDRNWSALHEAAMGAIRKAMENPDATVPDIVQEIGRCRQRIPLRLRSVIRFARETFQGDGAAEDTVQTLCNALESMLAKTEEQRAFFRDLLAP